MVASANFLIDAESNLKSALQVPQQRGRRAMIAKLIAASARNPMLVLIGTLFAVRGGLYAVLHTPLDAIPDLSDTQVIVYTEYPGQAPQVVEDQVTYPLDHSHAHRAEVARWCGAFRSSAFRLSISFSRTAPTSTGRASRVLEYLNAAATRLPAGVTPTLGPDATGVGWVYQYALTRARTSTLAETAITAGLDPPLRPRQGRRRRRNRQRRRLRQAIQRRRRSAAPARSRHHAGTRCAMPSAPATRMSAAARSSCPSSNSSCAAAAICKGIADLGKIVLKVDNGTPVLLKDVARVELGPDERRGITELNGEGEVASGIALQRFGSNALDVIDNVKKRLAELAAEPAGRT